MMALYASPLITSPRAIPAKNPGSTASILRPPLCYPTPSLLDGFSPFKTRFNKGIPKPSTGDDTTSQIRLSRPYPRIRRRCKPETKKFREEILRKLSKNREAFGDDLEMIVNVCAEVFSEFLHKEYGGPGTLSVEPFTEMFVALNEKKLPRPPVAARACLLWAQNYVDEDWEVWNSKLLE